MTKVPPKISDQVPWCNSCINSIVPYTLKGQDGTIVGFLCLTIVDLNTSWFKRVELPAIAQLTEKDGTTYIQWKFDKLSAEVATLVNQQWLSCYSRAQYITYDNVSEFKLDFESLCESFEIKNEPATVKKPQANAILECVHSVLGNTMHTNGLDMSPTTTDAMTTDFIVNAYGNFVIPIILYSNIHQELLSLTGIFYLAFPT
jgi:hypothetical protein